MKKLTPKKIRYPLSDAAPSWREVCELTTGTLHEPRGIANLWRRIDGMVRLPSCFASRTPRESLNDYGSNVAYVISDGGF